MNPIDTDHCTDMDGNAPTIRGLRHAGRVR